MKWFVLLLPLFSCLALASDFYPANILRLDQKLAHHLILVDKSTHALYVYANGENGIPKLEKTYNIMTGKYAGDKRVQGDRKTPEGIYDIIDFRSSRELLEAYGKEGEIYGAGAFVLNYPNVFDKRHGKTGGGIWLHSTNDNSRVEKGLDSRGCVVSVDEDLMDISRYVELTKTPFIIAQNKFYLSKNDWMTKRNQMDALIADWIDSWKTEDFDRYISHYHKTEYRDNYRKSYGEFRAYKKAVFSNPGAPVINISNITILKHKDHMVVNFVQDYQSATIKDQGIKTLYLKQNQQYQWKIIHEKWTKFTPNTADVAFTPSQRFFNQQAQAAQAQN